MGLTLKYHPANDRMTIGFDLSTGQSQTCWVTRRQWLFLILRISRPEDLPKQILGKDGLSKPQESTEALQCSSNTLTDINVLNAVSDSKDTQENALEMSADPSTLVLIDRIGVVQVDEAVRISFRLSDGTSNSPVVPENRRISLVLTPPELHNLEKTLRRKAKQAGWDVEAGLKRLSASLQRQRAEQRPAVH